MLRKFSNRPAECYEVICEYHEDKKGDAGVVIDDDWFEEQISLMIATHKLLPLQIRRLRGLVREKFGYEGKKE